MTDRDDIAFGELPPKPEAVLLRPPTAEQHAKELYGLPADWEAVSWEAVGEREHGHLKLSGGVYRTRLARGPRKGEVNYRKPDPGSEATVVLPHKIHQAWVEKWEAETGYCSKCSGTTRAHIGWNATKGHSHRPCPNCKETGRSGDVAAKSAPIEVSA